MLYSPLGQVQRRRLSIDARNLIPPDRQLLRSIPAGRHLIRSIDAKVCAGRFARNTSVAIQIGLNRLEKKAPQIGNCIGAVDAS
jgi:hypothetical protein